jgi:hypothetical protein
VLIKPHTPGVRLREVKVTELDVDRRPKREDLAIEVAAGTAVCNAADYKQAFATKQVEHIHVDDLPRLIKMLHRTTAAGGLPMDTAIHVKRSYGWLRWAGGGILLILAGAAVRRMTRRRYALS